MAASHTCSSRTDYMRATLHKYLTKLNHPDIYLLHADMWGFPTGGNVINCGVQETNMVNIAAGLASQGKRVIIYGVAGFVIYKAYEQIKLNKYSNPKTLNFNNHDFINATFFNRRFFT